MYQPFFVLQNPSSYNPIDFDRNMHAGDIDVETILESLETDKKLVKLREERLFISPRSFSSSNIDETS